MHFQLCPYILFRFQSPQEWETVFLIASFIHFGGVIFYAIFASGEKQPWADPPEEMDPEQAAINAMKGPNDFSLQEKTTSATTAAGPGTTGPLGPGAYGSTADISDVYRTTTETVQMPAGTGVYLNGPSANDR